MPFNRPSINDLVRRLSSDVTPGLPGTDPLLRRSLIGALVKGSRAPSMGSTDSSRGSRVPFSPTRPRTQSSSATHRSGG